MAASHTAVSIPEPADKPVPALAAADNKQPEHLLGNSLSFYWLLHVPSLHWKPVTLHGVFRGHFGLCKIIFPCFRCSSLTAFSMEI